ncbi:MAG: thioredoxin-disulfide reductase [Alphaproteobacteria bacterium]|nr:thioredoxin-disulfide reductase [Alphaproteobacteria bacterium]
MERQTKVLIIGGGPAGYTAAIYAARDQLKPILVQGMQPGGQLTITSEIENFPGFAEPVMGPQLMEQMAAQATRVGAEILSDTIVDVDLSKRPFVCKGEGGDTYIADTVIVATGAQARWLGLPSEKKFWGFGVSGCATCDGFFYRGKEIAVVGGGNAALEEALYLTRFASKVTLIHRRDAFRAEKTLQEEALKHEKIAVVWDSVIDEVVGDEKPALSVTGVRLRNVKTNETTVLRVAGLFVAIGHTPATKIFEGKLDMDKEGYLLTRPDSTATNVPGVFAAGDVKDKVFRQAITAAAGGCMAALEAQKYLAAHKESGHSL